MRRRRRHRGRRSRAVGRQDPASGVQQGEEEHRDKRKRVIHDGGVHPSSRASYEVRSSSELNSKHRIFLSYSRSQLDFVKKVCKDLEDRHRFPFLDIRESSLPLGETFEEHLLKAARQCRLAVVVVSEEYLSSEWPMRELVEFMRAESESNSNLKILPLFYKLSIRDLRDDSKQERWFAKWTEWAQAHPSRVNVAEYKEAFAKMRAISGIQFNQGMTELGFNQKVVRGICNLVSPDIKLYNGDVQGISSMYEDYMDKIQRIQPSGRFGVRVIGYHGVGGIGKTTMCKTLCNELSREFEDKVCHVELAPSASPSQKLSHLKEVLKKLTSTSYELLQGLNEDECKDILCKRVSWQQKTFLALDNVWDDTSLIEDVKMFIRNAAYHEGSVVMVTARCLKTLEYLGLDSAQCFEVPELSKVDAKNLFLFHAADGRPFDGEDDTNMIDECIARCHFKNSAKQGSHYLPLAVRVLGMHLGGLGRTPRQWLDNLQKARDFGLHYPEDNPVYSVMRLSFDALPEEDQKLFMGITVYRPCYIVAFDRVNFRMWLGLVHCKSLDAIQDQVQRLKEKGLLDDFDLSTGDFSMHDLYREFAEWESQGKSNRGDFNNRRWMYEDDSSSSNLERKPTGGVWQNLTRVHIGGDFGSEVDRSSSLQGIQWSYCSNVEVLALVGLGNLSGVLNLKDLQCLRSLELCELDQLDGVEGLENLRNLTYFVWIVDTLCASRRSGKDKQLGQLPASLKVLSLYGAGVVKFGKGTFSRCTNLCNLAVDGVEANDDIGLDQFTSLESLELSSVKGPGILASEELLDLHNLTRLQVLKIDNCDNISEVCGLSNLGQLRELHLGDLKEPPNLFGLQNLHQLGLPCCSLGPTVDLGMAGLPLLRHLDLSGSSLVELPDLSKMTALEELAIRESSIELQEDDIVMLAKLPRLRPLELCRVYNSILLDVDSRKVLRSDSSNGPYKECDLGILPIRVRDFEIRFRSY